MLQQPTNSLKNCMVQISKNIWFILGFLFGSTARIKVWIRPFLAYYLSACNSCLLYITNTHVSSAFSGILLNGFLLSLSLSFFLSRDGWNLIACLDNFCQLNRKKRILKIVNSPNTAFLTSLNYATFYDYFPVDSFSYYKEQKLLHKSSNNFERNVMQINKRFDVSDWDPIKKLISNLFI